MVAAPTPEMLGGICITRRLSKVSASHARHRPRQGHRQGRAGHRQGKYPHQLAPAALFVKKEYLQVVTEKQCPCEKDGPGHWSYNTQRFWCPQGRRGPQAGKVQTPPALTGLLILTMKLEKKRQREAFTNSQKS